MTDARVESDEEDDLAVEEAPALPAALRREWPAPRVGVYGTRDGAIARLEAFAAMAAMGAFGRLPPGARGKLVGGLARVAKRVDRRHSDAAREFIRVALGDEPADVVERRVLDAWRHFLDVTLDAAAFARAVPVERVREHFDLETSPDVERLRAERRGTIYVGAHVGDWEAGSALMPWIGFDPFYVIARPPKNRPLSVRVQALREARGVRFLPRRGAMQHAAAVIRAGGTLGMLLDQRARKRPVMAPFFGRMARCDRTAGVLLKRLGAPIVFGGCYRTATPMRWRAKMDRVVWPEQCAKLSVEELVGVVNKELERLILAAPEQYYWLHDRYRGA